MTTDEALVVFDEIRADRRELADQLDRADAAARAILLLDAARVANDDLAIGDPHGVVAALATPRLTYRHRMRWFSTLIEAVADCDRFAEWKSRDHGDHPHTAAALADCMSAHADRAALAVGVLLYGSSGVAA
jgi:hypothetical protein